MSAVGVAEQDSWGVSVSRDQKNRSGAGIILAVLCASPRPKREAAVASKQSATLWEDSGCWMCDLAEVSARYTRHAKSQKAKSDLIL